VSELISHETRSWNEEAVRGCCYPRDADTILGIPLPARATEDFLAWNGESNSLFNVRLAYRIGMASKWLSSERGQSSSEPDGARRVWELVWKAAVPPKVRIFAWHGATGSLAVRLGLHRHMPAIDPFCAICGMAVEDDHRALINCTVARALRYELRSF
jgi:hypothetical protein